MDRCRHCCACWRQICHGNIPCRIFMCVRLARWSRTLFSDPALHMHSSTSTAFVPEQEQSCRFRICTRRYALPTAAPVAYWRAPTEYMLTAKKKSLQGGVLRVKRYFYFNIILLCYLIWRGKAWGSHGVQGGVQMQQRMKGGGKSPPQNVNSSTVARCPRKLAGVQSSGIHHHCFDVLPVGSGFFWYGWHLR